MPIRDLYRETPQFTLTNYYNSLYYRCCRVAYRGDELINIQFSEEEKRELHYQRYHHPHPRVQKKMEVLWLKSQGFSHQDISLAAGVNNKTLATYLHQYVQGGIERLKELHFHQPCSAMTPHRTTIEAYFREHPPATAKEAAAKITELTGITRSANRTRIFLKKCGMRWRVTGVLPAKADPVKQEEFKKNAGAPAGRSPSRETCGIFC